MFTDHERLPEQSFTEALAKKTGCTILRGVELNVFVDVFDKSIGKINNDLFYHLLIGFDPEGKHPPDYWLNEIYRRCNATDRDTASRRIRGISCSPEQLSDVLAESSALVIPAHLHTTKDLSKSRSIDDIYDDPTFLKYAKSSFTALEIVNSATACYFDGQHDETGYLQKACIRSSDSHEPDELGRRFSYAQMEECSFGELRAALELPFRVSIEPPTEPNSYIVGMHVSGTFFPDLWLSFSPHCNMLIAVKGSGKTSVLECLRFALGAEVPKSRAEAVSGHLQAILGPTGRVRVLVKRSDGALVLVERTVSDRTFLVAFQDDRCERVATPDALLFPTQILGWHEIEQAATDVNIRRVYMDTIAGRSRVRTFEEDAVATASRIRDRHTYTSQRYIAYRDVQRQVNRLRELRRGLKELDDGALIALRDQYQMAVEQRESLVRLREQLGKAKGVGPAQVSQLLPDVESIPAGTSPIEVQLASARAIFEKTLSVLATDALAISQHLAEAEQELEQVHAEVEARFSDFLSAYTQRVNELTPEQQRLLATHREVLEQTKALPSLEGELSNARAEVIVLLQELTELCGRLAQGLDDRTQLRQDAVEALNTVLVNYGVRLTIIPQQGSADFAELSNRYASGSQALSQLRAKLPDRLAHLCLRKAYGGLSESLDMEYGSLLFESSELAYLLGAFENDDLKIELRVGKVGQEFSPIDQLSAGQRCTAIFPMLLRLDQGPLIVDQPEDNLDNRHIATSIAPALLADKRQRQMMFTSHNANLVVLSDAESVIMFESDGAVGRVENQGFFATRTSSIAHHVMDVLDGGEAALKLRALKYGLSRTSF